MSGIMNPPNKIKYPMKDIGRPDKFTPERRAAILDAISHRVPYELAAEGNGICEDTLYEWIRRGREDDSNSIDSEYARFSEAIKRTEMLRVREHNNEIAAKPERWQADAWILERRWNKHYGANAQLNEMNQRLNKLEYVESKNGTQNEETSKENANEKG